MALDRSQWVLAVLLGATVAATVWVSQDDQADSVAGAADATPAEGLRLPSRRDAAPEDLPLQVDKRASRTPTDPTQNAFASRTWVPPPPPVQQAPPPPAKPTVPPLPFTYMGKMQQGPDDPITVYLVQGEQGYTVKKGDIIEKTYRVESINAEQMVLTYLPMATKQTLSFGSGGS